MIGLFVVDEEDDEEEVGAIATANDFFWGKGLIDELGSDCGPLRPVESAEALTVESVEVLPFEPVEVLPFEPVDVRPFELVGDRLFDLITPAFFPIIVDLGGADDEAGVFVDGDPVVGVDILDGADLDRPSFSSFPPSFGSSQ